MTNSGLIEVTNVGFGDGVFIVDDDGPTTITNTGTIKGNLGVNVFFGNAQTQTLTNSGRIIGSGGTAINLGAADDSLIAALGGVIQGRIDLGAGNDTFRTETDLSGFFDFVSAPENVQISGPFAQNGLQFITFDRAILGRADAQAGPVQS